MWLILGSETDASALWLYQHLHARGLSPLLLVSTEALGYARLWEHRVGRDGSRFRCVLSNGHIIDSAQVKGAINRISWYSQGMLNRAIPEDRDYASQELFALYLSWLNALPGPVLNRPAPQGLCGRWRHESEWVWLAAQAGLPVATYHQGGETSVNAISKNAMSFGSTVIVLGDDVIGAHVPEDIRRGCRRLAELADTGLLGVDFLSEGEHPWVFAGATPMPDLRWGGARLIESLFHYLQCEVTPS